MAHDEDLSLLKLLFGVVFEEILVRMRRLSVNDFVNQFLELESNRRDG
jgi:hypothetical protein